MIVPAGYAGPNVEMCLDKVDFCAVCVANYLLIEVRADGL